VLGIVEEQEVEDSNAGLRRLRQPMKGKIGLPTKLNRCWSSASKTMN